MSTLNRVYLGGAELPADPLRGCEAAATGAPGPSGHPDAENGSQALSEARNAAARRGKANSDRGKRAERALVAWLRAHGWPGAERTVRTGHRTRTRVSVDRGDIDGTPGVCWQLKDVAEASMHRVPVWLAQTEAQRRAAGADLGVLVVKRRGHADPGDWWAHVRLDDVMHEVIINAGSCGIAYPAELFAVPVRLAVADLAPILHHAGYGDDVDAA